MKINKIYKFKNSRKKIDSEHLHEIMKRIVIILTVIWGLYLLPSFMLVVFAYEGYVNFPANNELLKQILYYNIMFFPFLLLISIGLSWLCLQYKRYWTAIAFSLLPLANLLIEITGADIAILLL